MFKTNKNSVFLINLSSTEKLYQYKCLVSGHRESVVELIKRVYYMER